MIVQHVGGGGILGLAEHLGVGLIEVGDRVDVGVFAAANAVDQGGHELAERPHVEQRAHPLLEERAVQPELAAVAVVELGFELAELLPRVGAILGIAIGVIAAPVEHVVAHVVHSSVEIHE